LAANIFSNGRTILRKGHSLSQSNIKALRKMGFRTIHIEDDSLDKPKKIGIISYEAREKAVNTVETVFKDFENIDSQKFEKIRSSAEIIVDDILGMDDLAIQMHDLRSWDDYTYRHCVNVTAISVAIAKMTEISVGNLKLLAAGALVHDIGKMKIPDFILNKNGKLSDTERMNVQQHPVHGFDLLSEKTQSSPLVWAIARQHHETLDGNGYPDGRAGTQIHKWAKIVSVADVWDALRSDRPYKTGWPPDKILNHLNSETASKKFDSDAIEILNSIVVLYPVGAKIRLSNGMIAEVQAHNPDDHQRPVVRVLVDEHGRTIDDPDNYILRLEKNPSIRIIETIQMTNSPVK